VLGNPKWKSQSRISNEIEETLLMQSQTDSSGNELTRQRRFDSFITILISLYIGATLASVYWNYRMGPHGMKAYHIWSYANVEGSTNWLGADLQKSPWDLWIYEEILYETKPDILIEAGTYKGGSAYYFASIFDLMKHGRVVTIDIVDYPEKPRHDRISYLLGSSTSAAIVSSVRKAIKPGDRVMVVLDSDHHKAHVLNELRLYSAFVTVGNYLVVEDTDINGHPVYASFGPGPMEALEEFLRGNNSFVSDKTRERYGVSYYPDGWLKRIR
jgi:cephalosporin hydroxylase